MSVPIKAAARLQASTKIFYRGLQETWNEGKAWSKHLTFVTEDRDYALEYAKDEDHLLSFKADIKHPFDFGFRTLTTSVQLYEVVARIRKGVMEQFKHGKIGKETGQKLFERIKALDQGGHKEVWEWYMKIPELSKILQDAGFDAIRGNEGLSDSIVTYGVFDLKNSNGCKMNIQVKAAARLQAADMTNMFEAFSQINELAQQDLIYGIRTIKKWYEGAKITNQEGLNVRRP